MLENLPQWGCAPEPTQNLIVLDASSVKDWSFLKTTKDSKKQMVITI